MNLCLKSTIIIIGSKNQRKLTQKNTFFEKRGNEQLTNHKDSMESLCDRCNFSMYVMCDM